jgi:hypothetical protein
MIKVEPIRISFCQSCMNRLYQLKETLTENLETVSKFPGVEFVLLNLNSKDELDDWVRDNCTPWIDQGVLVYFHDQQQEHFHMSRAKNLTHKAASGNVFVNLDCDNYIGDTIPAIKSTYRHYMDTVLHFTSGKWNGRYFDGTYGRLATSRNVFYKLGGYDESFYPVGGQDTDYIDRAHKMGFKIARITDGSIRCINNSKDDTCKYTGATLPYDEMNTRNKKQSAANIAAGRLVANKDLPKTRLVKNWKEEVYV